MTPLGALFSIASAIALLALPRRWAPLPLIAGACYMTLGQGIEIGPFSFTVIRILVAVGVIRIIIRSERIPGGMHRLDWIVITFGIWMLFTSAFHDSSYGSPLVFRLGQVWNTWGIYFLLRVFIQSVDDLIHFIKIVALVLVPVAVEMFSEKFTRWNQFSVLGGVPPVPAVREGSIRAQGPFAHAILAGTVGAVCFPLMVGLWRLHRNHAGLGICACLVMVFACASSGPIMSLGAACFALIMWRYKHLTKTARITAVVGYILLDIVMKAPAYYLLARIDIAGGSTGWHRARLIESSFRHLGEWWFAGTDYTRHWMPTGVTWSLNNTDITNHYLQMGVVGGLPLMLLLIYLLWTAFKNVGAAVTLGQRQQASPSQLFIIWALGSSLFAHAATCISVSYFDQSFVFIYLAIAAVGSLRTEVVRDIQQGATLHPVSRGNPAVESLRVVP